MINNAVKGFGYRVEIVPDVDADADQRIPRDVLAALGQHVILAGPAMAYIRQSTWESVKHRFPTQVIGNG